MQKTVKEWLKELTEPYKSQALDAATCGNELKAENLRDAIYWFADWEETPQGCEYWYEVANGGSPIIESAIEPTPTERQTAEALLKEFGEWTSANQKIGNMSEIINDFLTSKYGKG